MRARRLIALAAIGGCSCARAAAPTTPAPTPAPTPADTGAETPAPTIANTPGPTPAGETEYIKSYTGPLCGDAGIPCYAVGCGTDGMEPCFRMLPNCDFTLDGYADGTQVGLGVSNIYTNMVTAGLLPKLQLPYANFTSAVNITDLPIVLSDGGAYASSCTVRNVQYQKCLKDPSVANAAVTCSWETWYVNLRRQHTYAGLNKTEPEFYKIDQQFTIINDVIVAANVIPPQLAVSLYQYLSTSAIKLGVTCDVPDVGTVKSCVMFDVTPHAFSPNLVTEQTAKKPKYRFKKPPVPGFAMPPDYPAAYVLNVDNDIVLLSGNATTADCIGDESYYQGEDGMWYGWYVGSDGEFHELYEAFYASGKTIVMPALSDYMKPSLNDTLWGRNIRMMLGCSGDTKTTGWIYFGMGNITDHTYPEYDCLKKLNRELFCTLSARDALYADDDASAAAPMVGGSWAGVTFVTALATAAFLGRGRELSPWAF